MGVGRNLSYKKELFFRVKGFTNHMNLMTGDDDLFIKDAANKDNVSTVSYTHLDVYKRHL